MPKSNKVKGNGLGFDQYTICTFNAEAVGKEKILNTNF